MYICNVLCYVEKCTQTNIGSSSWSWASSFQDSTLFGIKVPWTNESIQRTARLLGTKWSDIAEVSRLVPSSNRLSRWTQKFQMEQKVLRLPTHWYSGYSSCCWGKAKEVLGLLWGFEWCCRAVCGLLWEYVECCGVVGCYISGEGGAEEFGWRGVQEKVLHQDPWFVKSATDPMRLPSS